MNVYKSVLSAIVCIGLILASLGLGVILEIVVGFFGI